MRKLLQGNFQFNLILIQDFIGAFAFFAPQALLISYLHDYAKVSSQELSIVLFIMIFFSRIGRIFFAPFLGMINVPTLLFILQILGGAGFYLIGRPYNPSCLYAGAFFIGLFYGNNAIVVRIATSFLRSSSLNVNFSLLSTVTNLASSGGAIILSYIFYNIGANDMLYFMSVMLLVTSALTYWSAKKLVFPPQGKFIHNLIRLIARKEIQKNLFVITVLWFSFSFFITFLPLYTIDKLKQPGMTWTVTAINGLVALVLSFPLNWYLKLRTNATKIGMAFLLYSASFALSLFDSSLVIFYFILFSISVAEVISVPAYQSIMSKNTHEDERFAAFSLLIIFVGFGESIGSVISVYANNHPAMLPITSLVLISSMIFGLFKIKENN